mmetsp:Transcript_45525/g.177038  ORF Transcript_45525/g.177038 Transcript_45525/m.177038 type:complete len:94 (-) Transcript_45525:3475-3756(-)
MRWQGGFHMLGSDRTKLETEADFERARKVAKELDLDGLVFIGGFDTNTNAMYAAEKVRRRAITSVVSWDDTLRTWPLRLLYRRDRTCVSSEKK